MLGTSGASARASAGAWVFVCGRAVESLSRISKPRVAPRSVKGLSREQAVESLFGTGARSAELRGKTEQAPGCLCVSRWRNVQLRKKSVPARTYRYGDNVGTISWVFCLAFPNSLGYVCELTPRGRSCSETQ